MSALLEVCDLSVRYGERVAVRGVSIAVQPGEAVGLAGPSGAGKSTLVAAVLGLLPAGGTVAGGEVRFAGEDLLGAGPPRMRELRGGQIGYVTQDAMRALNPTMRAGEQVAEAMTVHGVAPDIARTRVAELLSLVGLAAEHARSYPHELSGGQRQRIAIAAAIANRPRLLMADEPTTGLDVVMLHQLLDLLAGLRSELGLALVVISHDERVLRYLCDRVEPMPAGRRRSPAPAPPDDTPRRREPRLPAARAPAPVLELRNVSATYLRRGRRGRPVAALRDVDLHVEPGEIVGLAGRSGAGKSTIALLALGLLTPAGGEVRVGGQPLHTFGRRALRRERAGMHLIFQDAYDAMPEMLPVERVLAEPLEIRGERAVREHLCEALEHAGLRPASDFLGRSPARLSGGERQRLALARAIVAGPRLVIADEPTSMLDADLRYELIDRMRAMRDRDGTAFLFITHDLEVARRFCDRIVVLHEGRIVECGPADEVLGAPRATETRILLEASALCGRPRARDMAVT
ncbi:MAG: ABC transporter ATP-binding protein [Chloroflexi bacterium]|nr:ABC transporter ATP-binding protein [Chloroflexota bacterium]